MLLITKLHAQIFIFRDPPIQSNNNRKAVKRSLHTKPTRPKRRPLAVARVRDRRHPHLLSVWSDTDWAASQWPWRRSLLRFDVDRLRKLLSSVVGRPVCLSSLAVSSLRSNPPFQGTVFDVLFWYGLLDLSPWNHWLNSYVLSVTRIRWLASCSTGTGCPHLTLLHCITI